MRYGVVALLFVVGCTSGSGDPVPPAPGSETVITAEYPAGPYDNVNVGGVIDNDFDFLGYARPAEGIGEPHRIGIRLKDFYNPTWTGTYPEGSPFGAGEPKPKVLIINIGGVWCSPCRQEADQLLPQEYAARHPLGMEILALLADGSNPVATGGAPAGFTELDIWVTQFDSTYPSVIEPAYRLAAPFGTSFPVNYIIDTSTMTISMRIAGLPTANFWAQVDEILAQPNP